MKKNVLKAVVWAMFATAGCAAFGQSPADDPKYGETLKKRQENIARLTDFAEAYRAKDYEAALALMRELLAKAPAATENLYINGVNIYKARFAQSGSQQEKVLYSDSIMHLYDMRAEHFGENPQRGRGYISALKAKDCLAYRPWDIDGIRDTFNAAAEETGTKTDKGLILSYFNALLGFRTAGLMTAEEVKAEYERLRGLYDYEDKAVFALDAACAAGDIADCGYIEAVCSDRLSSGAGSLFETERAFRMMTAANCIGGAFYEELAVKLYAEKPNPEMAMAMAGYFTGKGDYRLAVEYIAEAAELEPAPERKALLYAKCAEIEVGQGNGEGAAKYARKALEEDPCEAFARLLLAQAHFVEAKNCTGFDAKAVYWLVFDMFAEAREALRDDQYRSVADEYAEYCKANFPSREECFFQGLKEGDKYKMDCGLISGVATVRFRK